MIITFQVPSFSFPTIITIQVLLFSVADSHHDPVPVYMAFSRSLVAVVVVVVVVEDDVLEERSVAQSLSQLQESGDGVRLAGGTRVWSWFNGNQRKCALVIRQKQQHNNNNKISLSPPPHKTNKNSSNNN